MNRLLTMLTTCALLSTCTTNTPAFAHDQYHDWLIPGTASSCCNESDCRPVRAEQDIDGNWTVTVDGLRIEIPADRILSFKAKDGRSHWCGKGDQTYCFTPGEIRS